jgi:hypothetical protein
VSPRSGDAEHMERSSPHPEARVSEQLSHDEAAASAFLSSFAGHGETHGRHTVEIQHESDKFRSELDDAARQSQVLEDRDTKAQLEADAGADALLASYNDAVNAGVSAYAKISAKVDDETARAFGRAPLAADKASAQGGKAQAAAPAAPKAATQQKASAAAEPKGVKDTSPAIKDPSDPLGEEKSIWASMGISGALLKVPREYRAMKDATGGERAAVANVPDYVKDAQHDVEDADYVRAKAAPPRRSMLAERSAERKRLDKVEMAARAPMRALPRGQSVTSVVKSAVARALAGSAAFAAAPAARAQLHFVPAKSTQDLYQVDNSATAQQQQQQQLAPRRGVAQQLTQSPKRDAQLFYAEENHLDSQIDAIYGAPATSQAPAQAHVARAAAREAAEARKIARVRAMAKEVEDARRGDAAQTQHAHRAQRADRKVESAEALEIARLKAEVRKMREAASIQRLKWQVAALKRKVQVSGASKGGVAGAAPHKTHKLAGGGADEDAGEAAEPAAEPAAEASAGGDAEAEGVEAAEEGGDGEEGEGEGAAEVEEGEEEERDGAEEEQAGNEAEGAQDERDGAEDVAEGEAEEHEAEENAEAHGDEDGDEDDEEQHEHVPKAVRVCDGMGCRKVVVPEHHWRKPKITKQQWAQQVFSEGGDLSAIAFPGKNTFEPEVHLNARGEIRADHDDPTGHLMPHNKYENAEYPDGIMHRRGADKAVPGITNSLARTLFADNIVKAAPGFNAGMGRHVRAQEYADYMRNWETSRPSKTGVDQDGNTVYVG